jgi:hypothetical protein
MLSIPSVRPGNLKVTDSRRRSAVAGASADSDAC